MTDLWNPVRRAELCTSCHIGNADEGKVLTHAMYAAGHPPLPGIEIATFSDAMPRHWQYLKEKLIGRKPEEARLLKDYYRAPDLEQTQLVQAGAAVSLKQSMLLLTHDAQAASRTKGDNARNLDLASFDCYACHHDLKTPSWRQERGYSGKPGRPQFRPWPLALIDVPLDTTSLRRSL